MRTHGRLAAAMCAASMAMMAAPRPVEEMTDEERKTPPEPPREKQTNLPGETNRQFAARMKATAQ